MYKIDTYDSILIMAKSRKNGDVFEYIVIEQLLKYDITPENKYTQDKTKRLKDKLDKCTDKKDVTTKRRKCKKCIDHILDNRQYKSYELLQDNNHLKTTADIIIHCDDVKIYISCKHNNYSIKHPRPSNLHKQLHTSVKYAKEYKTINDKYYSYFTKKQYVAFKEVSDNRKKKMYNEFNNLVISSINKSNVRSKILFACFLLGITVPSDINDGYNSSDCDSDYEHEDNNVRYILIYESKHVLLKDILKINIDDIKAYRKSSNTFHIDILHNNNIIITLKLRIHNASNRITEKISLKYDVTVITDNDNLYAIHQF